MLLSTVKHMSQKNENPHLEAFFGTTVSMKQFERCKDMLMQEMQELKDRVAYLERIVDPDLSYVEQGDEGEEGEDDQEDENEEEYSSLESESSTSDSGDSESDYEKSPYAKRSVDDDF